MLLSEFCRITEARLEPCQTSMMELFVKILPNKCIRGIWQGPNAFKLVDVFLQRSSIKYDKEFEC